MAMAIVRGGDCTLAFRPDNKTLAIASIKRDLQNLEAERALETDDEATLARIVAH